MTACLAILSLAMLCLLVRQRRAARRRYGALICEHKWALARYGEFRFRQGLKQAKERWDWAKEWKEATIFTTGANAVADQPRAGVSCAGREVSVSAPHCKPEEKERREPEPVTSGPNSGICILDCDSPSYPPSDDERRQCGCAQCLKDLERTRMGREWQEAAR